ncbi:5,6-dimethylbenzimidazole synthase [Alicyclobacillus cycloheptanicus]|nr:5,6-dimethylbenzimidazole synthase [Alicyclobacillus cycloheptanicus]
MAETATFTDARVTNPHRKAVPAPNIEQSAGVDKPPVPLDFSEEERAAVYKAILARRDIRVFLPDKIPDDVLGRILSAGHHGPSVGYMQPWNFIVIDDRSTLQRLQEVVERERVAAAEHYRDLKRDYYLRLKVEGLLQAPLTLCVTNDSTRGGPHVLGRNTIPETDLMSTACAIENMWLAARAEGVAMGWVSIYRKEDVRSILRIPDHVDPVALLTVGYTPHFPDIPVLERVGWGRRLPFDSVVYFNAWEQTRNEG